MLCMKQRDPAIPTAANGGPKKRTTSGFSESQMKRKRQGAKPKTEDMTGKPLWTKRERHGWKGIIPITENPKRIPIPTIMTLTGPGGFPIQNLPAIIRTGRLPN